MASIGQLSPQPFLQFYALNGTVLSFGQLFTYGAGTNILIATYKDANLTQPNTNPIILSPTGQATAFLTPGVGYKFLWQDSTGAQVGVQDNIQGEGSGSQGPPGVNGVVVSVTAPAIQVPADSSGNVTSFALANGKLTVFSGSTNVTEQCTVSLIQQVNCTATLNAVDNVPNVGQPLGFYQFTAMSANAGFISIQAVYQTVAYIVQVSITKSIPGASGGTGPAGPAGPPGPAAGLSLVLSNPSAVVLAYANGNVPSFAGISGKASMLNAGTDVSETTTWSAVASNLTGTVNTADNVPVAGQLIGYYQVTAMSAKIGTLTISATFSGSTIVAVFVVTQVPTGYQIVSSLPLSGDPAFFQGNIVFLTLDNQLYRNTGTGWTLAVPAVNITGQITTTQITPGAVTTPILAANSVTAAQIAANTITTNQIAAGTITSNNIQAGSIVAASLGVTQLSAISANLGTITAGLIRSLTSTAVLDLGNQYLQFNTGVFMAVLGINFGAASNYILWCGPTQSNASNFAACTDALAVLWIKSDGTSAFKGTVNSFPTNTYASPLGYNQILEVVPVTGHVRIKGWGGGGSGATRNTAANIGGAGGGGYFEWFGPCTAGDQIVYTAAAGIQGPTYVSSPLNGSNGNTSAVTGTVGGTFISLSALGGRAGTTAAGGVGGSASGANVSNLTGNSGTFAQPGLGGTSGGPNMTSPYGGYTTTPGGGGNGDITGAQGGSGALGQIQFIYSA